MTEQKLHRSMLPRIYFIDLEIASETFPNTRTLAKKYETSISSINRDIAFMKNMMNAPIEYDAFHRGYYYSIKNYRLTAGFAGPNELLALGLLKSVLKLCEQTPIYESASHIVDELLLPLEANDAFNLKHRIIVPSVPQTDIPINIWNCIISGLRDNVVLEIVYKPIMSDHESTIHIRPYQIINDNGAWFLYGHGEYCHEPRVYSMSRITLAKTTSTHFALPSNFDYRIDNGSSHFGVYSNERIMKFSIEFFEESAIWVSERRWAEDQILRSTENSITISFSSTQYWPILSWVLSQGSNARPLKPQRLVNDWKSNIKAMSTLTMEW